MAEMFLDAMRRDLIREILNVPATEHFDRVARINAPFVLEANESIYGADGYRNPKLLDGCNLVRSYLIDLAQDLGVDIREGRP